jgi:hypothetical protein
MMLVYLHTHSVNSNCYIIGADPGHGSPPHENHIDHIHSNYTHVLHLEIRMRHCENEKTFLFTVNYKYHNKYHRLEIISSTGTFFKIHPCFV